MFVKNHNWNDEKNRWLISVRGVSFEDVVQAVETEKVLETRIHPNQGQYPNQKLYLIEIDGYVWIVPFVENDSEIFLKTMIPSRKETKKIYGKEKK